MGIATGDIAKTGEKVTFIANNRSAYQIIMGAYTESHKKNNKHYQCIMKGEKLCVIEKGELCGVVLDSTVDLTDSIYKENIEGIVNRVKVVDDSGNGADTIDDEESQQKYGIVIQTVYKQEKDKDAAEEAADLFKKPEREGIVTSCKGDYRAMAGYSLIISDSLFDGQFYIKSDTHTFKDGWHEMKLNLEFENIMEKVDVEKEKPDKDSGSKTNGRKRKGEKADTN